MRLSSVLGSALLAAAVLAPALPAHAAAVPAIQITRVYYDSPGTDRRSNTSLNGEYVTVKNTTRRAIDLAGWTIRDKTGYTYTVGDDVLLGAGKKLTLRTGQGRDTATTLYWGRRAYVWNNDRDTAYVRRPDGRLVDSCAYDSTRADYTTC
ncbi:lamin tail domain-containing protein [Planomonospora sp. ID91781]|uniref:lamin tail domain-containing protein n=1 Tax=Planomonospora sp. ID91781 TaxID=2738135 RepID=UPI0027DE8FF1|nr:lamin tail domain-containing protein [Planomonospora sp. ID91781]